MSSFRAHKAKCLAESAAKQAADSSNIHKKTLTIYERYMGQLAQHLRQLKEVKSAERKAQIKVDLVAEYDDYIDGTMAGESALQNDILPTIMLWHIDIANYDRALVVAEYCIDKGIVMPERFDRTLASVLTEEIADASIKDNAVDLDIIETVIDITQDEDMHDQIRAKIHKAAGILLKESDAEKSAQHLQRAYKLDDRSGVKKMLDSVLKALGR